MEFHPFIVVGNKQASPDTHIIRLSQMTATSQFNYKAGQYVLLKDEASEDTEGHPFSLTSSPITTSYIEVCVKVLGDWTKSFVAKKEGDAVLASDPQGIFTWDDAITNAVFLPGGVGISACMSLLRYLADISKRPTITVLWGNRDQEAIVYEEELQRLQGLLPMTLVHIFSHLSEDDPWKGYRGFITAEIIAKEGQLEKKPVFFVNGPPVFISHTLKELQKLTIPKKRIRLEDAKRTALHR